jgi:hypothetical protein
MIPKQKVNLEVERTEQLPAQEKVAISVDAGPPLSADQVYIQRLAEDRIAENGSNAGFIP